ncbi:DciA family protein [Kitasatospora sp. NBC_01302]|uniref:DciA family protein n=1 Tax=Kitasatospora sp. NBC_01302 TaxID=2903575 RepID=UPI002E0D4804|nr:DciA family protein [Kitasatospora sp. NBC_01302]
MPAACTRTQSSTSCSPSRRQPPRTGRGWSSTAAGGRRDRPARHPDGRRPGAASAAHRVGAGTAACRPGPGSGTGSGADLARLALNAAHQAARRNGVDQLAAKRAKTTVRVRRTDGRDPVGLAGALQALMADRAWDLPVVGGSVLADWPAIAPELAGHVQAVAFTAATGQLDLRPASPAWAAQLRLTSTALLARINAHAGTGAVRSVRVLAPATAAGADLSMPVVPKSAAPVVTEASQPRERCVGYQRAMAAHRQAQPDGRPAANIQQAIQREDQALANHREPEQTFRQALDHQAELRDQTARAATSESSHARALRRARAERADAVPLCTAPAAQPRSGAA